MDKEGFTQNSNGLPDLAKPWRPLNNILFTILSKKTKKSKEVILYFNHRACKICGNGRAKSS
jgi:hypothetical protein